MPERCRCRHRRGLRGRFRALFVAVVLGPLIALSATAEKLDHRTDSSGGAQRPAQPRILFLASYHPSFPSFRPQLEGLEKGLEENGLKPASYILDVEFMDSKRFDVSDRERLVENDLFEKFRRLKPYNLLVVADDNALRFAISRQDTLFAGMNIVFMSVNNIRLALAQNDNPRIVGVIEKRSVGETLALARKLFGNSGPIHTLSDNTRTGRINQRLLEELLEKRTDLGPVRIHSLNDYTYDGMFELLRRIPPTEPLMLGNPSRDYTGQSLELNEFLVRVRKVFLGPILVTQYHGFGLGALGGRIVSHFEQGRAAASLAARILNGESPKNLRVITDSPNVYMFDHRELDRLGITTDLLPDDAIILNRPTSILDDYAHWVIGGAAAILLQLALIMSLLKALALRRKSAAALKEAAKLAQAANHAKSAFLSNMSHELRTPLNSIIGFSNLMSKQVLGPMNKEKYLEFAGDIKESGRHLLNLVNGILDLSKIEVGKMSMAETRFSIDRLVSDCLTVVEPLADAARVELFRDLLPGISVTGDETKIKQVLINVLSNAIKFTGPGGRITVSTGFDDRDRFRISVQDTGIGMTEDEIATAMTVFGQVENHLTKTREGTGLGLPLARRLTELHDGQLDVASKKGEGTTVSVVLPAHRIVPQAMRAA